MIRCGHACPVWEKRSGDNVVAYDVPPEDPDTVVVHYDPPWEDAAATVARARERLASDGWRVGRLTVEASGITRFTATRADLTMSVRSLTPPSNYYTGAGPRPGIACGCVAEGVQLGARAGQGPA